MGKLRAKRDRDEQKLRDDRDFAWGFARAIPVVIVMGCFLIATSPIWGTTWFVLDMHWRLIGREREERRKKREAEYFESCLRAIGATRATRV